MSPLTWTAINGRVVEYRIVPPSARPIEYVSLLPHPRGGQIRSDREVDRRKFLSYASIPSTTSKAPVAPDLCAFVDWRKVLGWRALPCATRRPEPLARAMRGGTAERRTRIRLVLGSYYLRIIKLESVPNRARIEPEERAKVTWGNRVPRRGSRDSATNSIPAGGKGRVRDEWRFLRRALLAQISATGASPLQAEIGAPERRGEVCRSANDQGRLPSREIRIHISGASSDLRLTGMDSAGAT